jgi:hypothetical protein
MYKHAQHMLGVEIVFMLGQPQRVLESTELLDTPPVDLFLGNKGIFNAREVSFFALSLSHQKSPKLNHLTLLHVFKASLDGRVSARQARWWRGL